MKLTYALLPASVWSLAPSGIWPLGNYDYKWHVKNWQAGLSHSRPTTPQTAWYVFDIKGDNKSFDRGDKDPCHLPAFEAHCGGTAAGSPLASEYANCTTVNGPVVLETRVWPSTGANARANVGIRWTWNAGGVKLYGNATQDWAREKPPFDFDIEDILLTFWK
ncbi:hypothetical protein LQW54_005933 [Pestalotiopsis sp. IQ-011]